jgi:hypothetical protein
VNIHFDFLDVGKLWPAQFAITSQHAIDYWVYLQYPTTLLSRMSQQLSDYPNLIDYAFYAEVFANGYRVLREEKRAREFATKAEEALQRLSFPRFPKLTSLTVKHFLLLPFFFLSIKLFFTTFC